VGHHGGGGTQFSNFGRHGSCEFSMLDAKSTYVLY
jgi:hypothetical protein